MVLPRITTYCARNTLANAKITFHGGIGSPTGSNFLLEVDGKKILIDCGLKQGCEECVDENRKDFAYDPSSIDMLFVTHGHLDHVGKIPKLVHDGFAGEIYSTAATKDIAGHLFDDSLSIMQHEARRGGKEQLYKAGDVANTHTLWKTLEYHEEFKVENVSVRLLDAGHILGSAMVEFSFDDKRVVFTGDLGNSPAPLLKDTEVLEGATHIVMESVYGDRNHEPMGERRAILKKAIEQAIQKRGVLMIPAFSIERTQVLLSELNDLVENKEVPSIPVFLDSPLAIRVTEVYGRYTNLFNEKARGKIQSGDDIFNFPKLQFTKTVDDSKAIARVPDPKIIIAGSGMSHAGRIRHHEKHYLSDPNATLLIVGYQALGTLGRQLEEGAKHVQIFDDSVAVRATLAKIEGYSAHKDGEGLLDFVDDAIEKGKSKIQKVFIALGEPKASLFLAQRLRDYLDVDAVVPSPGETVEIT